MRNIENLVFKGGGVLGIAYAGAIEILEERKILGNVKRVAGTSAGSIIATLLSLRYSANEVKELVSTTNFKDFEDHWDPFRLPAKYGLYKGEYFLNWIKKIIKDKTGDENITFSALHANGYRELKVFATDLNTSKIKEFSFDNTPDAIVAECVRASMSIPLFFEGWKFPNEYPDDHIYVDGGVLYNYPITAFIDYNKTLGFFLRNYKSKVSDLKYDNIVKYVEVLFDTVLKAQETDFYKNKEEEDITVNIDDYGISATNFGITADQKELLFKSGKKATLEYLDKSPSKNERSLYQF